MNTKLVATQVSLQNWMITFRDRQSSGLTIQEYCRQHGLSKNAYYYWLRKARKAALEENGFVEISRPSPALRSRLEQDSSSAERMELRIRDIRITLPLSVSRETLSMVIEVASHAQ